MDRMCILPFSVNLKKQLRIEKSPLKAPPTSDFRAVELLPDVNFGQRLPATRKSVFTKIKNVIKNKRPPTKKNQQEPSTRASDFRKSGARSRVRSSRVCGTAEEIARDPYRRVLAPTYADAVSDTFQYVTSVTRL